MTIPTPIEPFTKALSETWLLERTYHAHLLEGGELSTLDFTRAMKQMAEFSVPFSAWQEISPEEARGAYQQGTPLLLYGEHLWEHAKSAMRAWGPNKNMRVLIFGNAPQQPEAAAGRDVAVCYLDHQRGKASNTCWNQWFSAAADAMVAGNASRGITFFRPSFPFPSTIHYTVIASDGRASEYPGRAEAIQGFQKMPGQQEHKGSSLPPTRFPQFCYYHEVTCPDGVYRLDFFGPRMDEPGYAVQETVPVK